MHPQNLTLHSPPEEGDCYIRSDRTLRCVMSVLSCVLALCIVVSNMALWEFVNTDRVRSASNTTKRARPPNWLYFKFIVGVAIIAALIGVPLHVTDHTLNRVYMSIKFASYTMLFLLYGLTFHYIAAFAFERYISVCRYQNNHRQISKQRAILLVVTIYVLLTSIPLAYNMYDLFLLTERCTDNTPPLVTIGVAGFWTFSCNMLIFVTTVRASKFVRMHNKRSSIRLKVIKLTGVKRIKAVQMIWIVFVVLWIPFGTANVLRSSISEHLFQNINIVCRTAAFVSFLTLPVVYFFMDKRYENYVRRLLNRRSLHLPASREGSNCPSIDTRDGNTDSQKVEPKKATSLLQILERLRSDTDSSTQEPSPTPSPAPRADPVFLLDSSISAT